MGREPKRSGWRKVIDACPERATHLRSAIQERMAESQECWVQDDWEVGLSAVSACLHHALSMSDEDAEDLRSDIDSELQRPSWPSRDRQTSKRPRYRGGPLRIEEGEFAGEWPSFDDLEELIWSRGNELFEAPSHTIASIYYVGEDGETHWSRPLDGRTLDGTGYLTVSYLNENDTYVEEVIGLWSPVDDKEALMVAIVHAYAAWDDDNPWRVSKTISASDAALLDEVLKRVNRVDRDSVS